MIWYESTPLHQKKPSDLMNKNELKQLENTLINVSELKNQSERTLIYGFDFDKNTWHIYLKDNLIHLYVYKENEIKYKKSHTFSCYDLNPGKRIYPHKSDYEFCRIMKEKGTSLSFTKFEEIETEQFHGLIRK